jgi:hypothetical protein
MPSLNLYSPVFFIATTKFFSDKTKAMPVFYLFGLQWFNFSRTKAIIAISIIVEKDR